MHVVTYLLSTVHVAQLVGQAKHKVYVLVTPEVFPQAPLHVPPSQVALAVHPEQLAAQALQTLAVASYKYLSIHESHPPAAVHVLQLAPQAEQASPTLTYPSPQTVQTVADVQVLQPVEHAVHSVPSAFNTNPGVLQALHLSYPFVAVVPSPSEQVKQLEIEQTLQSDLSNFKKKFFPATHSVHLASASHLLQLLGQAVQAVVPFNPNVGLHYPAVH